VEERREIMTAREGRDDRFVPISHGEWLARNVPAARAHLLEGEGHISLSRRRYGDVLDELLASVPRP
jgi:pimeloyl-ACP methyl ester carboxylesterase